jgi:hypothetical protein
MATVCVKKLCEMQYRSTEQPLTSGLADTRSLAMLARSACHLHGVLRQSRVTRHDTSVDITLVKRTRALSVKLQSLTDAVSWYLTCGCCPSSSQTTSSVNGQLVRRTELGDQPGQGFAQVLYGRLGRLAPSLAPTPGRS